MSRVFDTSYVCHRAANAIVTQVDPLRVSSDALQIINQFLDEFITLLLTSAKSLDLSRIKTAVVALLPSSLGKNAIVEAELQVKSYTETADDIDYEAYERTRRLDSIPLDSIGALLRQECINHCTLAENNHNRQNTRRPSIGVPKTHNFSISPIVTVYVTSIIEHVAEYVLIAAATTAESQDTEYIRIKEVFAALSEDAQVTSMFRQMELRDRLKKRASFVMGYHHKMRQQQQLQQQQMPWTDMSNTNTKKHHSRESCSSNGRPMDPYADIPNLDNDSSSSSHNNDADLPCSPTTTTSSVGQRQHQRPMSIMSTSTSTNTISSTNSSGSNGASNKKRFPRLFKRRESTQLPQSPQQRTSSSSSNNNNKAIAISVYNPDSPTMVDFEDLIKSGDTVRMSLTPNRLRSIEVNNIVDNSSDTKSINSSKRSTVPSASPSINAFENPRVAPKPPQPPPRRRKSYDRPLMTPPPPAPPPLNPARRSRPQTSLERPSSMVAKRQTMILSNGGTPAQDGYFTLATGTTAVAASPPPTAAAIAAANATASPGTTITMDGSNKNNVKEKVLKFERHQRVSKRDASVQTEVMELHLPPPSRQSKKMDGDDPPPPPPPRGPTDTTQDKPSMDDSTSENGIVDGDEEWFVSEDEFEDEQTVVEWLLAAG
ncbi:hypothetical protein RO3G_16527 [Lichtheimia corymbifera JMRC:FSU:9682]|uniref:Uncharacterized protein n=1 Tax=Lichtheimia corymbifera JMRC:FSU:9682 TaxID=1263082 RepID=A0A068S0M8_9FUNG|nr:hypothetical protein RO3G_16527 [Lichtheimia corymbifera JMRC:FSU:9682]